MYIEIYHTDCCTIEIPDNTPTDEIFDKVM